MKITFFEVQPWEKDFLLSKLEGVGAQFFDAPLSEATASDASDADVVCVFVDSQVTAGVMEKLPQLKMIATRSTGFDHIDVAAAKAKHITVCNVPSYGENTVAEHTFALILDLSRKIHQSVESVKKSGFNAQGLCGFDLKGKALGVVGMGHIGQHVARIANGFEMKTLVFDARQDEILAKQFGFSYVTLAELLGQADIVTLHVPLNEHTKHLINLDNIGLMKKGAYIINTARGGIIQTAALVKALDEGILAGAALDVLEEECYIKEEHQLLNPGFAQKCDIKTLLQNHMLMERDNVVITPHNAFNSKEALERILETTMENIEGFGGGKAINTV